MLNRISTAAHKKLCSKLRSHDGGFIDLVVDYDLSSAYNRCGGIEVVGNLEIPVFLHDIPLALPVQRVLPALPAPPVQRALSEDIPQVWMARPRPTQPAARPA